MCSTLSSSDFKLENTATPVDVDPTPGKCGKEFLVFRGHMRMCVDLVDQSCIRSDAYRNARVGGTHTHAHTNTLYVL